MIQTNEKNFIISSAAEELPPNFRKLHYDRLIVSASKQPSKQGIFWLFEKATAAGKNLHIVDLREETSLFFANGANVTYYNGLNNDENTGLTIDEIYDKEDRLIQSIQSQKTIEVYGERKKLKKGPKIFIDGIEKKNANKTLVLADKQEFSTDGIQTEKEIVQTLSEAAYTRIPFTDHAASSMADNVNKIISVIVEAIHKENTWIHFHCHAGKGRASIALLTSHIFMSLKENQNGSLEEIVNSVIEKEQFSCEKEKYTKLPECFQKIHTYCKDN